MLGPLTLTSSYVLKIFGWLLGRLSKVLILAFIYGQILHKINVVTVCVDKMGFSHLSRERGRQGGGQMRG